MNKIKNSMVIASYVLLMTLFFIGGFALGTYKSEPEGVVQATDTPKQNSVVSAANIENTKEMSVYTVIMEDKSLNLYRVTGGEYTLLAYKNISEKVFPKNDVTMLKNGVTFDNLGDAQEMFENFVS